MKRPLRLTALAAGLLLAISGLAGAAPKETTPSYLIGLKPGTQAHSLALAGVTVDQTWDGLGAALVKASANGLKGLQNNPNIEYIEEDRTVYALHHGAPYSDNATYTWGLQAVHAPEAWAAGATGTGIKVCILDTGIDYGHPEFFKNGVSIIKGSKNFVNDGHPDATDGNGHGTHVAGTVAAQLGSPRKGVAPNVELYIGRVLGDDGSGSTTGVINGVNWCSGTVHAHIISLSLGSTRSSKTEQKAFDNAYNNGVLSIAASGNDGGAIGYPAGYASVVAVGAVTPSLSLADFSNFGTKQELVAPGVSIYSSVPRGTGQAASAAESGTGYVANALEFSPIGSVSGPLVECGLADSTSSCTGKPASGAWIALINRGTVTFADKVNNVIAQGASAAIIANNDTANPDDAGSFTLGAAGSWIPTVSVSYNSGVAIRAGGLGIGTVAVTATDYDYFDGTSMATPHVSAVAAVAWSVNPALRNTDIRAILQQSAWDLGAPGRDSSFGYGLVQADAAASLAATWTPGTTGGGGSTKPGNGGGKP
jgi:subtilisin family serine protease